MVNPSLVSATRWSHSPLGRSHDAVLDIVSKKSERLVALTDR
jgi:hypothetical protein